MFKRCPICGKFCFTPLPLCKICSKSWFTVHAYLIKKVVFYGEPITDADKKLLKNVGKKKNV